MSNVYVKSRSSVWLSHSINLINQCFHRKGASTGTCWSEILAQMIIPDLVSPGSWMSGPLDLDVLDWAGKSNGGPVTCERSVSIMQLCVGPPSGRSFASLTFSVVIPQGAAAGQQLGRGSLLFSEFHLFLLEVFQHSLYQPSLLLSALTAALWYTAAQCECLLLF